MAPSRVSGISRHGKAALCVQGPLPGRQWRLTSKPPDEGHPAALIGEVPRVSVVDRDRDPDFFDINAHGLRGCLSQQIL